MQSDHTQAVWLTESQVFSLAELAEMSGASEAELQELVEYGAVTPIDPEASPWTFNGKCLLTVRMACRLRMHFELEPHGVALTVSLLERINELEEQLCSMRAQFSRYTRRG